MIPRRARRAVLVSAFTLGVVGTFVADVSTQPAVVTLAGRVVDTQLAAAPGASINEATHWLRGR
jgi:hypothetical protein